MVLLLLWSDTAFSNTSTKPLDAWSHLEPSGARARCQLYPCTAEKPPLAEAAGSCGRLGGASLPRAEPRPRLQCTCSHLNGIHRALPRSFAPVLTSTMGTSVPWCTDEFGGQESLILTLPLQVKEQPVIESTPPREKNGSGKGTQERLAGLRSRLGLAWWPWASLRVLQWVPGRALMDG